MILQVLKLVLGFVMLIKGAGWFVDGTSGVAKKFGIPQLVIGLTIVAMGTSAPEAAVSINAALKGNAGITVGNVLGSNILNVLVILGLTGTIVTVAVQKSTLLYEIPFMLVVTVMLLAMGMTGGEVTRLEGVIILVLFTVYLGYLFMLAKNGKEEEEKAENRPIWKLILLGLIGGAIVVWGSDVTVDSATFIAKELGMDDRLIGLTIVALGTSLPELVTSVTAARKGSADIAIGNIVGSNLFNILFVLGVSAVIIPVPFASNFKIDAAVAILAGVLLWISVFETKKFTRPWGIAMLAGYAAYFVYLLMTL